MDVSVHFWFVVPVGMKIFTENHPVGQHIFKMIFPTMTPFVGGQAVQHRLVRGSLQIHVERRIHLQTTFVNLIGTGLVLKIAANFLHKIWSQRIRIVSQTQHQRRGSRVGCLRGGDLAIFEHGIDYQIPPPLRAVGMVDWRIYRRPFRQSRQQSRFFQSQLLGRLAEIKF